MILGAGKVLVSGRKFNFNSSVYGNSELIGVVNLNLIQLVICKRAMRGGISNYTINSFYLCTNKHLFHARQQQHAHRYMPHKKSKNATQPIEMMYHFLLSIIVISSTLSLNLFSVFLFLIFEMLCLCASSRPPD